MEGTSSYDFVKAIPKAEDTRIITLQGSKMVFRRLQSKVGVVFEPETMTMSGHLVNFSRNRREARRFLRFL